MADAREEIIRLMREEFDPHPNYELPAGQWDDNADDVADKIIAAALSESQLHISDAWRVLKKWLADYADEEAHFSRYRGNVMLDGVMKADERRLLWAFLEAGKAPRTVYEAVERVLDDNSAWIARPNPDVTKAVALASGVAYHFNQDDLVSRWREVAERAGVCMTCALGAPDPWGCSDCLNTGWAQGAPSGYVRDETADDSAGGRP